MSHKDTQKSTISWYYFRTRKQLLLSNRIEIFFSLMLDYGCLAMVVMLSKSFSRLAMLT